MDNIFAQLYGVFQGENTEGTRIFAGRVTSVSPFSVGLGKISLRGIKKNADIEEFNVGDEVLILSDTEFENFYVVCRLRG